jgi:hypothetical protein
LSETINYEEDKVPHDDNTLEKPLYESTEGPIPKNKVFNRRGGGGGGGRDIATGKSGANMLLSGESFGMHPLRSKKFDSTNKALGGGSGTYQSREKIADNFLEEEDDDDYTSRASESGEIDPTLFR